MKKIFKIFILIPNLPFFLFLTIYTIYMIYKHTNIIDLDPLEKEDFVTDDIKNYILTIYPRYVSYSVGIVFWFYIISMI